MSFLFPAFLLGLLALAVPLLLHLIRRRVVRSVPFPALRFLAATRADEKKHRLRRRLVLALRCLALAALAAAFARPFLGDTPPASGRATIVVIDNSFSLQAADRWPALLRQTRSALGTPAPGDSLGLLLMNPRPAWLLAPTRDTAAALAALETLRPGWQSTRAEPALRLAAEVLASTPARDRRILFLGDHQALGWTAADFAKKLPPGLSVVFPEPAPAPARQAALLSLSLALRADTWIATATTRNFSPAHPRTLSLFAENSPTPLATASLALAAGATVITEFPLPASALVNGAPPPWLRATLDPDSLPADDSALALAPSARGERLLLLDRPSAASSTDYVATAYAALAKLPPALRVLPPPATAWPAASAAVLRSDASFTPEPAARLDAFLAAGGSALLFPTDGPAQRAWLARHRITPAALQLNPPPSSRGSSPPPAARLRDWTLDHPLVEPLAAQNLRSLVGWEFTRAWSLPADTVEPLAFWADGSVALGEFPVGAGRVLLAGFTPERRDGDWPVQPAFIPFLHRAATHLLGLSASTAEKPLRVGDPLPASTAPGAWRLLAGPASETPNFQSPPSSFPFPGIYEFTAPGQPRTLHAVGLDPAESDLAPWPEGRPWQQLLNPDPAPPQLLDSRLLAASAETEHQNPLWWWAFAALALFALAELSLANRTTR
jgi:hypothetical protein